MYITFYVPTSQNLLQHIFNPHGPERWSVNVVAYAQDRTADVQSLHNNMLYRSITLSFNTKNTANQACLI